MESICDDEANDEPPKKKRLAGVASTSTSDGSTSAASAASPEKGPQEAIGVVPNSADKTFDADIHLPPAWEALATTIQELKETQTWCGAGARSHPC